MTTEQFVAAVEPFAHRIGTRGVLLRDDHLRAALCEHFDNAEADAVAAAGDDDHAAVERFEWIHDVTP